VHYAETFIIPEAVKEYTIRPYELSDGKKVCYNKGLCQDKTMNP
jgi:hypothetical protein